MRKQIVLAMRDLRFVVLFCRHCHTSVTLDLEMEFESPGRARFRCPPECPRCNNPFDSAVPAAIEAMQKVYKAVANLDGAVTFTADATSLSPPPAATPTGNPPADR